MKRYRRVTAFIAAILLLLQGTVGPFAGLWAVPAQAREEVRMEDVTAGEPVDTMENAAGNAAEDTTEDVAEEESEDTAEDATKDAADNASNDGTYRSGETAYAFYLKQGDTLNEGVIISMNIPEGEEGVLFSGRIYNYNISSGTESTYTFSDKQTSSRQYITDGEYEVQKVEITSLRKKGATNWQIKVWLAGVAKGETKTTRTGDEIDVSDLEIGDVVVAGTYLSKGDLSGFNVVLDDTDLEVTLDEYGTYEMTDTARVLGKGKNKNDSSILNLVFETADDKAKVNSEEGLLASFNKGDMITLSGDIALTRPLVIDDGKSHVIKLAGHGIYRADLQGVTDYDGENDREYDRDGSVIELLNGSELTIEDKVGDKNGWIGSGYAERGGGVHVGYLSKFIMTGGAIMENHAGEGGGIYVSGKAEAQLKEVTVSQNNIGTELFTIQSKSSGGGIYVENGGRCTLNECIIEGNYAYTGGGIANRGYIKITDSDIQHNITMGGDAGGVLSMANETTIKNSRIVGNISGKAGGGVYVYGEATIEDCTISENSARYEGGGIYDIEQDNYGVELLGRNKIINNSAAAGGGMYIEASLKKKKTRAFENLDITGNYTTTGLGGGLCIIDEAARLEVSLRGITIGNNTATQGGGVYTTCGTSFTDCEITGNTSREDGGGIYKGYVGVKADITLKDTSIGGNISYKQGGGIYIYDPSKKSELILDGGKIEVSANVFTEKRTSQNSIFSSIFASVFSAFKKLSSEAEETTVESNVVFSDYRKISVAGKLSEGSKIGITYLDNFTERTATDGYGEYNDEPIDTYFSYDGVDHKVKRDDDASEVEIVEKVHATAKKYTVKVKITVTDDADDWDNAYLYVYGRGKKGIDEEKLVWSSGDIKSSVDNGDDVYDSPEIDCGDSFPSKINVYAKFGGGLIHRDWEADVKIWINGVNCGSRHIAVDVWGNTADKGKANNYITIAGDKYPYPEYMEVEQSREIDPSDDSTKKIGIIAVDQYGVMWDAPGSDYFKMENISFPEEDTIQSLNSNGLEFSLDTTKDDICHNSKYVIKYKSGSNYKEWVEVPVVVRFVATLKLRIRMGNDDDGYQEVETKAGKQNKSFTIKAPEPPIGYKLKTPKKEGVCSVIPSTEEGEYNFTFMSENVVLTFETEPVKYSIVYDKNTSDATMVTGRISNTTTYYNQDVVLAKNSFKSKAGYTFAGWNTAPDGSGTSYTESEVVRNLSTTHRGQVTLYAQWQDSSGNRVTASLFSTGSLALGGGVGLIICALVGALVIGRRRKKQSKATQSM